MTKLNNMDEYQRFIATSRYARWMPEEQRRENWEETIDRLNKFWTGKFPKHKKVIKECTDAVHDLEVMGSMRTLMTAGEALDRDNVAGFNCSYAAIDGSGEELSVYTGEMKAAGFDEAVVIKADKPIAFDEIMYVLMCGTGAGFSVERQYIATLPLVGHKLPRGIYARNENNFPKVDPEELSTFSRKNNTVYVQDSKTGWASALRILIVELYNGNFDVQWDVSKVRAAGERLKTFGGRASGPKPLVDLFQFSIEVFKNAQGRKLTSIECHDLVCKIADIVVVGGVRRSALISLSNLTDDRMRIAKSGAWWDLNGQRALANNSVAYTEKPDMPAFMKEWTALMESGSGERGIFYRGAAENLQPERRKVYEYKDYGTNPCSEIVLRNKQFCNLSEVVVRADDTLDTLKEKVRKAAILGTMQASLTDFRYLSKKWKDNTEEESLLGVSLTGIMDHTVMSGQGVLGLEANHESGGLVSWLEQLKEVAVETNKEWAKKLGVNPAASVTCVKPSGTVSQLVDSSSGIHPRFSDYYIRTVRADKKDPLALHMQEQGFPCEDDVMKPDSGLVFSFPVQAPEASVKVADVDAIQQLELWKTYQLHWCEHKPSVTIYVNPDEWMKVGAWVYDNFDIMSGVSFLPYSEHTYRQAPYQEITKEEWGVATENMPKNASWEFEENLDTTTSSQTMACSGGSCEVVDL